MNDNLYVFLDEFETRQGLSIADRHSVWKSVFDRLTNNGVVRGVNFVGVDRFGSLNLRDFFYLGDSSAPLTFDIVAFNAVSYPSINFKRDGYYLDYREAGGEIAWGVVDSRRDGSVSTLYDVPDFREGDLVAIVGHHISNERQLGIGLEHMRNMKPRLRNTLDASIQ